MVNTATRNAMIRIASRRNALLVLAIAAIVEISGCGSNLELETYPVTVKVSFPDGATLEGAIVAFHSSGDSETGVPGQTYSAVGKVGVDGTCQLTTLQRGDGAVAGQHRVTVAPPPAEGDLDEMRRQPAVIHPRYKSVATSGLVVTVSPEGHNEIVIPIERP